MSLLRRGIISSGKLGGVAPPAFADYDTLELNSNKYLTLGNDASLSIPTNLGLCAWINPTVENTDKDIITKFRASGNQRSYLLTIAATNILRFWVSDNGQGGVGNRYFIDSSGTIPINQWTHVMGTYDGTDLKVYINGVEDGSLTQAGITIHGGTEPVAVGASADALVFSFQGNICLPMIMDDIPTSLETTELQTPRQPEEYSAGLQAKFAAALPLNDGTITPYDDTTANSNDATAIGSPSITIPTLEFTI